MTQKWRAVEGGNDEFEVGNDHHSIENGRSQLEVATEE